MRRIEKGERETKINDPGQGHQMVMQPNLPNNKNPRNKPQRHKHRRDNEEDDRNDQDVRSVILHFLVFLIYIYMHSETPHCKRPRQQPRGTQPVPNRTVDEASRVQEFQGGRDKTREV